MSRHPSPVLLGRAATAWDLRTLAIGVVSPGVLGYVDGVGGSGVSYARARDAYDRVTFSQRVLRDVAYLDTRTRVFGREIAFPLIVAPTAFTRMMHPGGEIAVARAAAHAGIPYTLSTLATTTIRDLVSAVPNGDKWFQLYMSRDTRTNERLLDRVKRAGFRVLAVTVDVPATGDRWLDCRHGFIIPPQRPSARTKLTVAEAAYWKRSEGSPPVRPALFPRARGTIGQLMSTLTGGVTTDGLDWLRSHWDGPLVVKGVMHEDDAMLAIQHGADGIVVSNHGGRQLDGTAAPLEQLPRIVEKLGSARQTCTVLVDSGIMTGRDVAAALCYGADACLVGRAPLYGLMAAGQPGVDRAISLLHEDFGRTMQLLGVTTVGELGPDCLHLPPTSLSQDAGGVAL